VSLGRLGGLWRASAGLGGCFSAKWAKVVKKVQVCKWACVSGWPMGWAGLEWPLLDFLWVN